MNLNQNCTPIKTALEEFQLRRVVPFDVPGHKRGRGNPELTRFLGQYCMNADVNSMKPLDNLCHPVSVIAEAERLTADAFGAANAFFMVGGTTSSVQAMLFSSCKNGDKIILPRNVHRSVINAMVLIGCVPVYVNPCLNKNLGISLGMELSVLKKAVAENPDAKAILVNNPTYYGICSNIKRIAELAHAANMLLLADEAHGTHFYYGEDLPINGIKAGADMAAVSMHKSGGSLTQSSILLCGKNVDASHVRQIINLTQSTSGSYLLLSSLDISRKNLALNGKDIFARVVGLAEYAREEINKLGDYYAYSLELINADSVYDFDTTKLAVHTLNAGLAGIEVYDILRDEYDIQIEFGDLGNILAYISVGDRERDLEQLVGALKDIRRKFKRPVTSKMLNLEYINPIVKMSPQEAFYAKKTTLSIAACINRVCGEFVMCYPPGIPIAAPGELITRDIIEYILYAKEKGCFMTGTRDEAVENIMVVN
ncbi:MAG: aminotransferase class I/II-fold pyridoxal phosphate-dependent enzyme [Oscillospiraceae bacterium]|nr:aminotransferase class I/II-fold pyridoxal phosphate-dependent enzyme [Oscillospiraceae bacterium]